MKFLPSCLLISLAVMAVLAQDETESTTVSGTETVTGGGRGRGHGLGKAGKYMVYMP